MTSASDTPDSTPNGGVAPEDLSESVAGEEDPGASLDMLGVATAAPMRSDQPEGQGGGKQPSQPGATLAPGQAVPMKTPGSGDNACPRCGGSGKLAAGTCPECQGSGKLTVGIGGA